MASANRLNRSQIGASDALYDYTCIPCEGDGKNSEALYKCIDCQVFYCERCVAGHNKFTVNHNVVPRTSTKFGHGRKQAPVNASSDLLTDLCGDHHGEVIKMYCGQHDLVCCTVCIAVKHRACYGIDYIPNIAKRQLKGPQKYETRAALEKVKSDLQRQKNKLQTDLLNLDKQRDHCIEDIRNIKKRVIAKVEEMERASVTELKAKHEEIAANIDRHRRSVENMITILDSRLENLKAESTTNNAQLFVDIKLGNIQARKGRDCARKTSRTTFGQIEFSLNSNIKSLLNDTYTFGLLRGYVNIWIPEKTDVTDSCIGVLQDQLRRYALNPKCIKSSEIDPYCYTVVVCQNDASLQLKQKIKRVCGRRNKIVVMELTDMSKLASMHVDSVLDEWMTSVIGEFYYKRDRTRSRTIRFPVELNQQTFKSLSMILRI